MITRVKKGILSVRRRSISHKGYCFGNELKRNLFEVFLVDEVEGVIVGTIDVKDGDDVSVGGGG